MNWPLVFALSLFGLGMALGTVFVIPSAVEPLFWLVIFVVCAYFIAQRAPASPFLHGLMVGIVNSVWVTSAHVLFFNQYIANHPREAAMMASMPLPNSPRTMMTLTGPVVGVISGAVLGLFALVATKLTKKAARV